MIKAGAKKDGLDISEQYLVDCGFGKDGANGCNGAAPGSYAKFYNENGKEKNWKMSDKEKSLKISYLRQ